MSKLLSIGFMKHMKVAHIVWIVAAIGLLLSVAFAQSKIRAEASKSAVLKEVSAEVDLAVLLSAYMHEQQKERNATTVFLASQGDQYADQLKRQRVETDRKYQAAYATAQALADKGVEPKVQEKLTAVLSKMDRLNDIRSRVDALSVSEQDALTFYSNVNYDLARLIGSFSSVVEDAAISNKLLLYAGFLLGKDAADTERALVASGFTSGVFPLELKREVITKLETQSSKFDQFIAYVDPTLAEALQQALTTETAQSVQDMRQVALSGTPDEVAMISPEAWLDASADKVALLRSIDTQIVDGLRATVSAAQKEAQSAFWTLALVLGVCVFGGIATSLYFVALLSQSFKNVLSPLNRLADGDLDFTLPPKTRNEMGEIISALDIFQTNAINRREAERAREGVLDTLADGMGRLSTGDFSRQIEEEFPQAFERLRSDFNSAVTELRSAKREREENEIKTREAERERAVVLDTLTDGMGRLSNGDFSQQIDEQFPAAFERLRSDFNAAVSELRQATAEREENELKRQQSEAARREAERAREAVLDSLAEGMGRLSGGDFTRHIEETFPEAFERLRSDFNTAVTELRRAKAEREESERMREAAERAQNFVVENLALSLGRLAQGNLIETLDVEFTEEYEKLRHDFNDAVLKLRETVSQIKRASQGIRDGAVDISKSADDLSDRTERQAATLEETSAAMEQITSTVAKTAEGATIANDLALAAQKEASDGGEVVRESVIAMQQISQSSEQIAKIIDVIDDIAFQTNLLALNAGVEAARAGDAGKGFSVVANEVRALAQRSSDAAREIKELIDTCTQHVETGVDLVGRAGDVLEQIVSGVSNVSAQVSEITLATQEQSTALSEINSAVNQLDQVTQQNAVMVGETTRSSHSLTGDADKLMAQVSRFDIGEERRNQVPGIVNEDYTRTFQERRKTDRRGADIQEQQAQVQQFVARTNGSAAVDTEWTEF